MTKLVEHAVGDGEVGLRKKGEKGREVSISL
jgi:hypothetical protein